MATAQHELQQGQSLQQAGKRTEARQRYERALQLEPANPHAHFFLGTLELAERQPARAALHFQKALTFQPDHLEAACHLALAHQAAGHLDAAIAAYRRALALRPDFPEVLCNLGNVLHQKRDFPAAIAAYRDALRLKPDFPEVHNSLGVALRSLGQLDSAVASYRAALALKPDYLAARSNLALALRAQEKWDEAHAVCRQVLATAPDHVPTLLTLGGILEAQRQPEEAAAVYRQILAREPQHAGALANLGGILQAQGRLDEAIALYRRALAADPHHVETLTNLGTALQARNDLPGAIASYERALAAQPDLAQARFNLGICQLTAGDFRAGWRNYEARWQCEMARSRRAFAQPLWLGETPLAGKTILVYPEQGLGDTLQFIRYIPQLAALGAKVVLEVQPPLRALVGGFPGTRAVVARGDALPPFDAHCPLLSLPLALSAAGDAIPADVPYLRVPAEKLAAWQPRFAGTRRPRIGLVWSGGPHHKSDHLRSIPLEVFKSILAGSTAQFFCLQKDVKDADAPVLAATPEIIPLAGELRDFADTAAIIAQLDLVISVDTSVAHLAGALGKPVWILLPFAPDWRWQLARTDSPWYPTAKLFRQPAPGDWPAVLAHIRAALA